MKVINIFGAPGAGKSTTASGLFYEMKKHWIECEYIQEFAKELVWSDSTHLLSQQNYIFAEQERRLNRLNQKIDVAISDSPLILSSFYSPKNYPNSFHECVFDFFNTYKNINIFVKRSHEYSLKGRVQNQIESDELGDKMFKYLIDNDIEFYSITASNASPKRILAWLVNENIISLPGIELEFDPRNYQAIKGEYHNWMEHHNKGKKCRESKNIVKADLELITTVK